MASTKVRALSYIVETPDDLPLHLRDRAPFTLMNTEIIFRLPSAKVVGESDDVLMAGAIEFQTQITPGLLTDLCDPDELFSPEMHSTHRFRSVYDPNIQRGIKETKKGPKEFLRQAQIEDMKNNIYENDFECPQLMWNLRAGETSWVYITGTKELRVYDGVGTRPDTNHRHHAIVGVHRQYLQWIRQTGSTDMGSYNPDRAYGLVIYTDDEKQEAHRFYVYNFLGYHVPTSTAHYMESKTDTPQLHNRLARELMEHSGVLGHQNVEILSNHLSRNSAKMITFGTLVDALKRAFPGVTEDDYQNIKAYLTEFLQALADIRPQEIGLLSLSQRQKVRANNIADQAIMWHAYMRLAATLRDQSAWRDTLNVLKDDFVYVNGGTTLWNGDLFDRHNPAWVDHEVIVRGKTGPRVVNNRQSREGAFKLLCNLVIPPTELEVDLS